MKIIKIKKDCPVCHNSFFSSKKKKTFCSHQCYWEFLRDKIPSCVMRVGKIRIICPVCSKVFFDYFSNKRKVCSRKCQYLFRFGKASKSKTKFRKGIKGENHYAWKGGKPFCIDCGKRLSGYNALRHRECYRKFYRKENHWHWMGGKSFEPYPTTFDEQLKDKIRVRDNFICQLCGVPELECDRKLHNHHIDYCKENCEENNLTSLCVGCNSKVNFNREYWKKHFQNKMEVQYGKRDIRN